MVKTIVIEKLGEVDKGRGKRIVIRLMEINACRYLDLRIFELADGVWQATWKGITLSKYNFDSCLTQLNDQSEHIMDMLDPSTPEEFAKKINKMKPLTQSRANKPKRKPKAKDNGRQVKFNF